MQKLVQTRLALAKKQLTTPVRNFSQSLKPPSSSGSGMLPWIVGAGALGGFTYLNYRMSDMRHNRTTYMAQGETFMSQIVQERLGQTFGFFAYGLLTSGATCYALRNSLAWTAVPWWGMMLGGFALLMGTHAVPYETAFPLKLAMYTGFAGLMGLNILPLVQVSSMAMIADAALATGVAMGSLSYIAYKAPS